MILRKGFRMPNYNFDDYINEKINSRKSEVPVDEFSDFYLLCKKVKDAFYRDWESRDNSKATLEIQKRAIIGYEKEKDFFDEIDEATGDVLVCGLGLGYYPFMVSLKKDVKSITVIEKDPNIIKIFKENLFKFFPNKDKIHIVQDDAIKYLKETRNNFTYCFIDLWHNPEDGLPLYLRLKPLEKKNTKYAYWLETGIKAMYRRCALIVIEEVINGPFDKILETDNLPGISTLIEKFYSGSSPFQAEVYFINLWSLSR